MNPLYLLLLLPLLKGDGDSDEGFGFDSRLLLALALLGGGQFLGTTSTPPTTSGTSTSTIDPSMLLVLAMTTGGDFFGSGHHRPERRAHEIGRLADALGKLTPAIAPEVNINISA